MAKLNVNIFSTFVWSGDIDGKPFDVKSIAQSVDDARQEVLSILASIDASKQEYDELKKKLKGMLKFDESLGCMRYSGGEDEHIVFDRLVEIGSTIKASYSNELFDRNGFDFHSDAKVDMGDGSTINLSDFIRNTEPFCLGCIRAVSFPSCRDEYK
jgi:hypothetical protein